MGICHLMKETPPSLLLSGVNRGLNLGMETVFSGTVGGAMTGMMLGVPSIALSQAYKDRNNPLWDASRTLGAQVVRDLLAIGWSKDACLNVNFPTCTAAEAGPISIIALAMDGVGSRAVWTLIQTCLIVGSIFFATGILGEQIAVQRAELRELRQRIDAVRDPSGGDGSDVVRG